MDEKSNEDDLSPAGVWRNHAEEATNGGERLYSVLSRISTIGIFRTDVSGNYVYVNDRWCLIVGMKQSEAIAGGWARAIHPDDRDRVAMAWSTSKQAHLDFSLEYRVQRPDGEARWVLGQATAERNAAGELVGYLGTITDITELKHSEEALLKSEKKYHTLYDSTSDAVMLLDEKGFFHCNRATLAMFGCETMKEFCSKHPADLSPPVQPSGTDSFTLANLHIAAAMKNGSNRFEWLHQRADNGRIFFADVLLSALELDGKRVLQATVRDITERKKLEEERQEALQRLQKIAAQVPGVVYQFRLRPDGGACVPYASEAAREIYRVSPEEIREDASRIFTDVHPDDLDNLKASIEVSARDLTPWQHEYRLKFDDGTVRWLFGNALPQRDADGSTLWHGFITDVTARKRVEAEMFAVQSRLKATLEAIPDLLFEMGLDGRYHDCHATHPELLAAPAEELIGKTVREALPPEAAEGVMLALREAHENGSSYGRQIELQLPQGSSWFELSVARKYVLPGQEPRFIVLSRDITKRKRSEERLRHSEEMLRAYMDNVSDTIWVVDANLNMIYVSPSVTRLLGVSPEELIGRPGALVVHPDDMGVIDDAMRYVMEHPGVSYTIHHRVSHKEGRWIHVESTGRNMLDNPVINGVLVTMRDITERKRAEEALRASELRYRLLVEFSPLCIHEIDMEGRLQSMNRAGLNMLGMNDAEKICGMPYLEAVSRKDAGHVAALLQDAITKGIPGYFEFAAAGDAQRYFKSCFIPIKDSGGRVLKLMGITEDITERRQMEMELRHREETLNLAQAVAQTGSWYLDIPANRLEWSLQTYRMFGIPQKDAINLETFIAVVHPDDRDFVLKAWNEAMAGAPYDIEHRIVVKGQERWVRERARIERDSEGRPLTGVGTVQDITERRQIEETLRESEASLSAILNNLPYLAWLKDAEGRYLKVNKIYADYARLKDAREAIGKTDLDLWPRELAEKYRADDAEVMATRRQKCVEDPSLDGDRIHWTETFKTPVIDDNGNVLGTAGYARDITERKQAELALAESENRFREIFNAVSDAIFIHDVETGRILDVNRRMLEMYGLTREEALACGIEELSAGTPPYSSAEAIEKIHLARTSGPQTFVWLARAGDGHLFWAEVSLRFAVIGSQQRILATVRDITERRKAEAALRESEYRWKFALEGSGDGLWDWNLVDNTVFFSRRWKEMLGFAEDEIGNGLDEWEKRIHPDDRAETLATVQAYLDGKTPVYQSEHRVKCKDGSWKWILDRGMVVSRNEDGKPLRMIGTHADISERKRAEEQIHNLAFYDTLTQLPNRRMLNDRMNQAMASSKRSGRYGALLFLDLDNFKPLNDRYGHAVGDLLLKEVARRISSCLREMDTVARFGGDEFVVMLTELDVDNAESAAQAGIVAEKIRVILAQPYVLKVKHEGRADSIIEHNCTSSIGVVLFIDHRDSTEDIIKWADMAMYQAKEDGRNLTRFYRSGA
jgi:diguanylate cyclase (GGDEF)-like protein/PAS domain S-box-containing protein